MDKEKNTKAVSEENIYCLNGRVPVKKAIPFGLQHVLAMFVSNLAPVLIVCSAAFVRGSENHLSAAEITQLLQCAMFAAGIGTCLQLYPVWKIGSRLPIVMGVSFTFLGSLLMICTNPELGYEGMVGAVIAGGIFEGLVGMSAKYWKRFLTPVVSACVVIAIGLSLLSVGMDSWGGGNRAEDFGAWYHLLVGFFTLVVCLAARYLLKGVYKNLNVLVGLVCGYLLSIVFTVAGIAPMVDFSGITKTIEQVGVFSLPKLVFFTSYKPVFDLGAFYCNCLSGIGSRDNRCNYCSVYRCVGAGYQDGGTAGVSCCGWILQCDFRMLWLSAAYFFQSEYRARHYDRSYQSFYYSDGGFDFDPCFSVPAAWSFFQFASAGGTWRMYGYDVRIDHV